MSARIAYRKAWAGSRLWIFAAVLLSACAALATTVIPQSVEQLTHNSAFVVSGHSVRSWSAWDAQHKQIYTYTEFAVEQTLKGQTLSTILVREFGGSAGGYTQKVAGVTPLRTGERAVLFLNPGRLDASGALTITGLMQGNFRMLASGRYSNGVSAVSRSNEVVNAYEAGELQPYVGKSFTIDQLKQRVAAVIMREQTR